MEILRVEGLVVWTKPDFADATVTDFGRRVLAGSIRPPLARFAPEGFSAPDAATLLPLPLARQTSGQLGSSKTNWYRVSIPTAATYRFEAESRDGDTVIQVRGPQIDHVL